MEVKLAEEKERRRQAQRNGSGGKATNLTELMAQANQKQNEYDAKVGAPNNNNVDNDGVRTISTSHGQQSRRAYLRSLKKVIESSDVILQVLDARDPLGTRIHSAIESGILSHFDKRMVLVLNKIDLIPKSNVNDWLTYLRKGHPTVALKAGTTQSRSNESGKSSGVGQTKGENALNSSLAVGVDGLLQLLKNYARSSGEKSKKKNKTCITVGIIGYPNVGKSSILNSLKRFRAVGVSSRPGFTTSLQEVVLDKNIRLIDSPGVVFDDDTSKLGAGAILRNGIDADSIDDPIPAIQELLERCTMESLMMTYNVPAFPQGPEGVMTFLAMVARTKGRVLKGGIPDKTMAARLVLKDWNKGKIPYYSVPPNDNSSDVDMTGAGASSGGSDAKIVSKFSEEFDTNKIMEEHDKELMEGLQDVDEMDFVQMNSTVQATDRNQDGKKGGADTVLNYLTKDQGDSSDDDMDEEEVDGAVMNAQMAQADDFDFDQE